MRLGLCLDGCLVRVQHSVPITTLPDDHFVLLKIFRVTKWSWELIWVFRHYMLGRERRSPKVSADQ